LLPDPTPVAKAAERPAAPVDPAVVARCDAAMVELGRMADRYGVMVALRSSLSSFAALRRAIGAAACPWFGVDFDPVSALQDHQGMDEIFSAIGGLIRHVRGRDGMVGDAGRFRATVIGHGAVDWNGVLGRLRESDFKGWVTVDPLELANRRGGAIEGREFLNAAISA
jgi:sugar phosphate isomerase/epimerase